MNHLYLVNAKRDFIMLLRLLAWNSLNAITKVQDKKKLKYFMFFGIEING